MKTVACIQIYGSGKGSLSWLWRQVIPMPRLEQHMVDNIGHSSERTSLYGLFQRSLQYRKISVEWEKGGRRVPRIAWILWFGRLEETSKLKFIASLLCDRIIFRKNRKILKFSLSTPLLSLLALVESPSCSAQILNLENYQGKPTWFVYD